MTKISRRAVWCLFTVIAACGDATAPAPRIPDVPIVPPVIPPTPPPPPPPAAPSVASIRLDRFSSFLGVGRVHTILALALNASGELMRNVPIVVTTSDSSVAAVEATFGGLTTIFAKKRGVVTITARSDSVSVRAVLNVRADAIEIDAPLEHLAHGQSVQLVARLLDATGNALPNQDTIRWSMASTPNASLSESGVLSAHSYYPHPSVHWIYAQADELNDSVMIYIHPAAAGEPATLRIVHAAAGLHPVTFQISDGTTVTLAYGEIHSMRFKSGGYRVGAETPAGHPGPHLGTLRSGAPTFSGMLAPDEKITLYLTGDAKWVGLHPVPDTHAPVAAHQALVRVMMAGGIPSYDGIAVYFSPPGIPIHTDGLTYCYDLFGQSKYTIRTVAELDIVIMDPSNGDCSAIGALRQIGRITVQPAAGYATTYVITAKHVDPTSNAPIVYDLITIVDR